MDVHALVLSTEEIMVITHRKRPKEQMRELGRMRIPATLRIDNTVCVLRMYVTMPSAPAPAANDEPQLKSSRK